MAIAAAAARGGEPSMFAPATTSGVTVSAAQAQAVISLHPKPPVIALDGDRAGREGTDRWLRALCLQRSHPALVSRLPEGVDPAEWLQHQEVSGLAAFEPRTGLEPRRSLRAANATISTNQWRSFDATAYRLLHELVGPERVSIREQILSHASMARILNGYPSPLAAPNPHTTYNARQAANHLGVAHSTVVADIRASRLPATYDGRRYSIKATELPTDTDVHPADPASTDPLDQLLGGLPTGARRGRRRSVSDIRTAAFDPTSRL